MLRQNNTKVHKDTNIKLVMGLCIMYIEVVGCSLWIHIYFRHTLTQTFHFVET